MYFLFYFMQNDDSKCCTLAFKISYSYPHQCISLQCFDFALMCMFKYMVISNETVVSAIGFSV